MPQPQLLDCSHVPTWAVRQQQLAPVLALAEVEGPGHARPQPAACHTHPAAARRAACQAHSCCGRARGSVSAVTCCCTSNLFCIQRQRPPARLKTEVDAHKRSMPCLLYPTQTNPTAPHMRVPGGKRSEADVSSSHCRRCCSGGPCSGGPSSVLPGRAGAGQGVMVHRFPCKSGWMPSMGHAQHSTARHGTVQHSTAQHSTAQQDSAQHSTVQHGASQHSTVQHGASQRSPA